MIQEAIDRGYETRLQVLRDNNATLEEKYNKVRDELRSTRTELEKLKNPNLFGDE